MSGITVKLVVGSFLCLFVLAASAGQARASNAEFGTVSNILATSNGAVLFDTTGARTTPPACQGPGLQKRWAINASTLVGQTALSVLMTAYSLNKRVVIIGTGVCNIWGDTETVNLFMIEN